jgi:hypothetical protein
MADRGMIARLCVMAGVIVSAQLPPAARLCHCSQTSDAVDLFPHWCKGCFGEVWPEGLYGPDRATVGQNPALITVRATSSPVYPQLAVVDSEALGVDQRLAKSPQTSTVVSDRKTVPPRLCRLHA